MATSEGPVVVATAKADVGRRLLAALIDGVLCAGVSVVPVLGGLVGAAYAVVRDGLDVEFMMRRSIGKQVMKVRAVRLDGQPMDLATSVKRNLPFMVGLVGLPFLVIPILGWTIVMLLGTAQVVLSFVEVGLVLTDPEGRRLGDRFAGTRVVDSES
jgi:uncharacterized RDD family membrane protein YckC